MTPQFGLIKGFILIDLVSANVYFVSITNKTFEFQVFELGEKAST